MEAANLSLQNRSTAQKTRHKLYLHVTAHWVIYLSVGVLLATVAVLLLTCAKETRGQIIYALDDAYIHMAIAKNIAQHGVFGVTQYEFTSSSSSLLWTLILSAIFWLFGPNELVPLVLNIIFASALLTLIYIILKKFQLGSPLCLVTLVCVIYFGPLPLLILIGMEHVLQILINAALIFVFATMLKNPQCQEKRLFWVSILLAAFATTVRFEGLFLIFAVCFLYVIRKRPMNALYVGLAGILPILLFGIFSVYNNWLPLPNSVIIKGNFPDLHSVKGIIAFLGLTAYRQLARNPHLLIFILSIMFFVIQQYGSERTVFNNRLSLMGCIYILTALLHLQFAQTGWFYRYGAYLVVLGLLLTGIYFNKVVKRVQDNTHRMLIILFILIASSPLGIRAIEGLKLTPVAMTNIYQQQYQMGLFLNKFYKGTSIAANDIGAISYLADNRLLDLFGLASIEVGKAVKANTYNTELIDALSKKRDIKIAVVYENYGEEYPGNAGIPKNWQKVGEWKIQNKVVCREDTVAFFAVNSDEAKILADNLRKFSVSLPSEVEQKIY